MEHGTEKKFPTDSKDYKLYEEIGEGVSATVYRALCVPLNEIVAIKVLDLERCNNDLDGIRSEVQTMSLIDHPNVLRAHCSFTADHNLWVVTPYMAGGSALHIMKTAYQEGFEEPVIATLLREVLKALVYLHSHGHIHRDVKSGNILLDGNGAVKLADFGVSACMFDTGDRQRSRNTFVGTPCWMAPEVMQQLHGYDFKADIWSFGITALELAHGHAPFSKYPPMKVLLMTLQNAPPGLDYERDKRFSKAFKEMVATCLVKDPKKRPTSEKLLKHPFFKHGRTNDYLAKSILEGLPPLGERFRTLKGKEGNFLLNNKALSEDMEQLSQQKYIRGISGWNFNLDDLKAQAALLESSEDGSFHSKIAENNLKESNNNAVFRQENHFPESVHAGSSTSGEEGIQDIQDLDGQFASAFQSRPLEALKSCFDMCEDEQMEASSPSPRGLSSSSPFHQFSYLEHVAKVDGKLTSGENNINNSSNDINSNINRERSVSVPSNMNSAGAHKYPSGSLIPEHVLSPYRNITADNERDVMHQKNPYEKNHSGPLSHRQNPLKFQSGLTPEETTEEKVIEHRGRFKVTSADVIPKVPSSGNMRTCHVNRPTTKPTIDSASLLPSLQFLLQQNAIQKEELTRLVNCIEETSGFNKELGDGGTSVSSHSSVSPARDKEMQGYLVHLQQSVMKLSEDLQRIKSKNAQLEQQINALSKRERG